MSTEKNEEAVEQSADSTEAFHEPQQQAAVAREWPEQLVVAVDGPSGITAPSFVAAGNS